MTRSHVLLHCKNPKLMAARLEAWEGKNPGGVRVLLANPRWERWFGKRDGQGRREGKAKQVVGTLFLVLFLTVWGYSCPRDLCTAHLWRSED